ncbi:MAG TPA: FAD-dependent oxidoreductase [Conexibacter sp.]|nr:FAD-dependent oxidoreductase [Conexibacter sp.]
MTRARAFTSDGSEPPLLDVAVIGGGPAGCSAAIRLASGGLDVAIVNDASGTQSNFDVLLTSVSAQALRETPTLELAVHQAIETIRLRIPGRPLRTIDDVGAFSLGRGVLNDALFFAAMSLGVRLRADTATAIDRAEWGFEIHSAEKRTPLRARHLILAGGGGGLGASPAADGTDTDDGARRALAVAARCAGESSPGDTGMEMVFVPPDATALRTPALSVWAVPGPAEGTFTVRVAVSNYEGEDHEALLAHGLDALRAEAPGFGELRPIGPLVAGELDTGYSRLRLEDAEGLLVGDAAGLVNPFTGEGLSYALESGALAAAAVLAHRDKPAAAQHAYVRRIDFLFAGNVEASRRAVRRDHLAWRFLSDAAESDHPFLAKGRRAILLPEGLRGITDPLIAQLDSQLQALAGPFLVACDEVMVSTIRDDWPFLARMAVSGAGRSDERLRPALLMLGAALAAGGELDVRCATLGGGLELAMMGALAFLGAAPDVQEQRGLDWSQVSIVVGGDFLLGQAARLIATFGPTVSWAFAEWLADLATLRAQRIAGCPGVPADATSAALYEFPARLGAELAGADATTVEALRDFGSECGRAFLHVDEVLALTGRRTRLDTTLEFLAANRLATDGIAPDEAARTAEQVTAARAATAQAEQQGRAAVERLSGSPGRELLEAFLVGVCGPAQV